MLRLIATLEPFAPARGLAIDEVLLESAQREGPDTLRFWVNDRAVVIGRSQAFADEVDLAQAAAARVPVLRRVSGGGAVVHHPGNLNLSISLRDGRGLGDIAGAFEQLGAAVCASLRELGIPAAVDGNRLLAEGKKIGGAAQARRGRTLLYHTTLLLSSDTIAMSALLRALQPGYAPSGVASRPYPTASLEDLGFTVGPTEIVARVGTAVGRLLGRRSVPGGLSQCEKRRASTLVMEKYGEDRWNRLR